MYKLLEHTRRPDITFNRNGCISITARVARMLSLRPGDSINIAVSGGEYLLHAIHHSNDIGRHLARCFPSKRGGNDFRVQCVALCRSLFASVGITSNRAAFMVGEKMERAGVVYVPIITRHPL